MTPMPGRRHYLAIFFVSLSLLMLEITIARMLTVALFSHYAFVAISLAMFGLGLSGLVIYLLPARFPAARLDEQLTTFAALFGVSAAASVLVFLHVHVVQALSVTGFVTLAAAYTILAVPFFLGGLCISLLMTHFSARIAPLYFADLVGASVGCLGVVTALWLAPAPQVAVVIGLVVSTATLAVALGGGGRRGLALASVAATAVLTVLAFTTDLYQMRYIKQRTATYSEYEAWNQFSRVSAFPVDANRNAAQIVPLKDPPSAYAGDGYPPSKMLDIDGAAWTPMMGWNRDPSSVQFLRDSVLYAVHAVRPNARVLVIGTGGGRDLLAAAAAYGQPSVLGIEINPLMRHIVEERFGDYSGHPYTQPHVQVIIDEARSRLSSLDQTFDIIQLSLIDTFSLNAAGGFVFSENYLYTVEGFEEYFEHLSPDGILSLTRYFVPVYPLEILRLIAMARAALEQRGVTDFQNHVAILLQDVNASMMVKKTAFTGPEIAALQEQAKRLNARVLYGPWDPQAGHPEIVQLITTPDWRGFVAHYPYYIHPPTDDRPFFFNFLRGLVRGNVDDPFHFIQMWNDALVLMYMLIAVVSVIAVLFFLVPLLTFGRRPHRVPARAAAPLLFYFACLGYGFLMIEIPLLQRLVLFLGYPVYALAVVLFALLFFSGLGSLLSSRFTADARRGLIRVLAVIVAVALVYLVTVPRVIEALLGLPIALRIGITVGLLAPIGLLLGMAYPLGITVLRGYGEELVPWAWGLNGVMSVVASVVSTFIGSRIGFSAAFLTGITAYLLGLVAIAAATRGRPVPAAAPVPNRLAG